MCGDVMGISHAFWHTAVMCSRDRCMISISGMFILIDILIFNKFGGVERKDPKVVADYILYSPSLLAATKLDCYNSPTVPSI